MTFLSDYQKAFKGNFLFVPINSEQNMMGRFIPEQFSHETYVEKQKGNDKDQEKYKDDPKKLEEANEKFEKFKIKSYQMMSFEISNHYQVYYNKEKKEDTEGKKKYSLFVKSLMLKFFDLAEGVYNDMTIE
jgi:hypothetical protein